MIGFTRALALEVVRKQPRSAIEMAAIVTYYLANMAPKADRKESVGTADLDIYFKIAEFKLPAQQKFTLVNARPDYWA